ncbi:MAG: hypothetical protein JWQ80_3614 [Massilia sp.]|nr:hypothetical protein [Massilia sp.]
MPKLSYWIGQYLIAVVSMFVLLLAIDVLMRGETLARAWPSALAWAAAASAIFIGSRYRNMRNNIACGVLDKK